MIINTEQDNTIEGNYLEVISGGGTANIVVNIPSDFYLTQDDCSNWLVGWGSDKPLYDAGFENLRTIKSFNVNTKTVVLGELKRGSGFPENNHRIVFWNTRPSSFYKEIREAIIDPSLWPEFKGESIGFSSVVFDSITGMWTIFINEVDTDYVQIYTAVSTNLRNWSAGNEGKALMTGEDFKNVWWAGKDKSGTIIQSAIISDVIFKDGVWYFFMDGYDEYGKRHIGLVTSEKSIYGPYTVQPDPLISPGSKGDWNDESCFYAKVTAYKNSFIMFYDGRNSSGEEAIGMATSTDLVNWTDYEKNPVLSQHSGWRSSATSSEPNYIEVRNDSIFLMVSGVKKFKMGFWHHYFTRRMYMDKSGNVNDAQLGVYLSTDGGVTFTASPNNPVFINDYSDPWENDHMGGNFELIKTDTADFIFYQAKTDDPKLKYSIFYRIRTK